MKKILYNTLLIAAALVSLVACSADSSLSGNGAVSPNGSNGNPSTGIAGSTAKFAISGDHLYVVDDKNLNVFNLNANELALDSKFRINTGPGNVIETIFPRGDALFLGSQMGMIIYNISNPTTPQYLANIVHVLSCDPVVADDKYAYVTLRSVQGRCGRTTNQLMVIDIQNLTRPAVVRSYQMVNPKGLGIQNNALFVCDDGLKLFNATNANNITLTQHFQNIPANDLIPMGDKLLMVADDGLYQYTYDATNGLQELSKLEIVK